MNRTISAPDKDNVPHRDIYCVSRLNLEARTLLERGFPGQIWIEGELSNLARPSSGHMYFSLKDANAQVRCAMFRGRNVHLNFVPENGMQVLLRARVSLYEGRGEFQLVAEHMEESGDGLLRRAFEELKQRLAKEGLFDEARKNPLPSLPARIGVVTSPTGAAIRDVLTVLKRRFPAIPVVIYPVAVQGEGAAADIAETVQLASRRKDCDVLIVTRGGGSLEDLWAFNEEVVARAIHHCEIPVVAAIGHEIDITIADFVADQRAPTPSAAAELVAPDHAEWLQSLSRYEHRLNARIKDTLNRKSQQLQWLEKRLWPQHPQVRLQQQNQRLDELEQRLTRACRGLIRHRVSRLAELSARLHRYTPAHRLDHLKTTHRHLTQQLIKAMGAKLERERQRLTNAGRALDTVSPLATLARGYAVVTRQRDNQLVREASQVTPGERIEAKIHRGTLLCTVDQSQEDGQ